VFFVLKSSFRTVRRQDNVKRRDHWNRLADMGVMIRRW
jgi:hypothetical protein